MRGAPRGRPAGGGARAAVKHATRGGGGVVSPFSAYDADDVDRAATREAKAVADQLLRALGGLARKDHRDGPAFPAFAEDVPGDSPIDSARPTPANQ